MSEQYRGFYDITEDIIKRLKEAGCAVVTFGDTPDYMKSQKSPVTPGAHVSPVGFSTGDTVNTVNLQIWVYDLLTLFKLNQTQADKAEYGDQNIVDALDTTMAIIDKFMKPILSRTVQINSGGYYRLQSAPQWSAEYEEGNNRVSGWVGTINITMQNYTSACN